MLFQNDINELHSIVFYSLSGPDALSTIRVLGPANAAGIKIVPGVENGKINVDAVRNGEIVLIQRDVCRYYEDFEAILQLAHSLNKPLVLDLDDLLFELPEDHPDRQSGFYTDALLPLFRAVVGADLITVATSPLKEYLLPFNKNVVVVPNYLNDKLWKFSSSTSFQHEDRITIGYMGGHSHKPDIELVVPALQQISQKYFDRIHFQFWGIEAPQELAAQSRTDWCPPDSLEYSDFVQYFQTQTADVVIAPLGNNLFNSCKSPIKYFEYNARGLPGVYSNIAPYAEVVNNGVDGFLATSIDEWVEMISTLVDNIDLRSSMVDKAQAKIKKNWLLTKNFHIQFNLYRNLINRPLHVHEHLSLERLLRQLSTQHYEEIKRVKSRPKAIYEVVTEFEQQKLLLTKQVDDLQQRSQELVYQNNELIWEIASLMASKSWRYTRPIRKLMSKVSKVLK